MPALGPCSEARVRPGLVEYATQRRGFGIRDHADVGRLVQAEQPALAALLGRAPPRLLEDALIDACELAAVAHCVREGVGGIEHVLLELGRQP